MRIRHIEIRNFRGIKNLSWAPQGNFSCLIGAGDSCKTTILLALDYALSPRTSLLFDDSDFYNQDVEQDIVIQVTLTDWDETRPDVQKFFQENKYAQYKCGVDHTGPLEEPTSDEAVAVSLSLRVDKGLEPKWSVARGRDDGEATDKKPIYGTDRAVFGLSRIDIFSDYHFTWGRNTILTRLSDSPGDLGAVLSILSRDFRQTDIAAHPRIAACQTVADTVQVESGNAGVQLGALEPRIDIQRQSLGAGALSLYEENVPLRNKGSGSKKLIGTAMQMKLHDGKNISLIDEIEVGLEPHRIRGLIYKLRNSSQQVFATTHSPVVLRELSVAEHELYVCKRHADGTVAVKSVASVPDIQRRVRSNAEAFLGKRIIACEGATEIGLLRAYDVFRLDADNPPVWSLATAYFDCGGAGEIKTVCPQLTGLGYQLAALCDNDAPTQLSDEDVARLRAAGVHVCHWEQGNSTEGQLFAELPWAHLPDMLGAIATHHDTLEYATIIDDTRMAAQAQGIQLGTDPSVWPDLAPLRAVIGERAHQRKWIKRIDYARLAFARALPLLPEAGTMRTRLEALWDWVQRHE